MEVIKNMIPAVGEGMVATLGYFGATLLLSLPLSFVVVLMRLAKNKPVAKLTGLYIYVMQGTPLMLQLVFVYFGLPYLGIAFSREIAALIAFVLNYAAYFSEILRGGIQSIDPGQTEASQCLGFSQLHTYRRIIMPQVMKRSLPAFGNECLTLLKDTALISVLGLSDILKAGRGAANTYASALPFVIVGVVYLALSAIISYLLKKGEKRYAYYA